MAVVFVALVLVGLLLMRRDVGGAGGLTSPDRRGWGHPGAPASTEGATFRRSEIVSIRSHGIQLWVNRRAAPLISGFLDELVNDGYLVRQKDTGAYSHRYKRCATPSQCEGELSDHSWGTALDVNWTTNPLGSPNACDMRTDLPSDVAAIAARWGLAWGGEFPCGSKDPMHFEIVGRPQDVRAIVDRNAGG